MSKRIGLFIFIIAFAVGLLLFTTSTKADMMDGGHWFSLDTDSSAGGSPGDIQHTPEDGTFGFFDALPVGNQDVDVFTSDLILFSLASGGVDAVGDNVYWYSAFGGGVGGLYLDPGLTNNVDALDVHQSEPISEPATIALLGIGLVGLAGLGGGDVKIL